MLVNTREVMDLINEMEERYPVDHWTIGGIHIWPVIRISLAMQLIRQNISKEIIPDRSIINKANDYSKRIAKLVKMIYFNYSQGHKKIQSSKVDYLFMGDQVSRIWLNDTWYDRFCDPFIEYFNNIGKKCIHMEARYNPKIPSYKATWYLQPRLDFIRLVSLLRKSYDIHSINLNNYDLFVNELHKAFPELDDIIHAVPKHMGFIAGFSRYFEKLLSMIKPEAVFIVEYYNISAMSLVLTCRRLNIPTVDIQHGVQGDLHVAYGRWQKIPKYGFNVLPEYFWVWNESEANAINNWRLRNKIDTHKPFIGGNVWLEMWKSEETALVKKYNDTFNKSLNRKKELIILFTLQPLTLHEKYPEWIVNAIRNSPRDWIWLIRLHPGMLAERQKVKEYFMRNGNAIVEIDIATDYPLPIILRNTDVHITNFSSTVIEAQDFGIYSVVVDHEGEEYFKHEIETGWVISAHNENDLIEAIYIQAQKRQKRTWFNEIDPTAKIKYFIDMINNRYDNYHD